MKLLARYVLGQVLFTCAAAVVLLVLILVAGNVVRDLVGSLLGGQLELATFLKLVGLLIPYAATWALPLGFLTGILLVLGRLSAQHEITAMRAAGLGVARLAAPIFTVAVVGVILSAAVNFYWAPNARTHYKRVLAEAVRTQPKNFIIPKTFIRDFPGYVIYVGEVSDRTLRECWVWMLDKRQRVVRQARAESGEFAFDEERGALTLVLHEATIDLRDEEDPEAFTRAEAPFKFGTLPLELAMEGFFRREATANKKLSMMTLHELVAERAAIVRGERDAAYPGLSRQTALVRVQAALQSNLAVAFSLLSFALVGVPLGIKVQRRETSVNLLVALGLALAYYLGLSLVKILEASPEWRPDLLVWLPNVLLQALGGWLLWRVEGR